MAKETFGAESLMRMDGGRIALAINNELHRVIEDLSDRPADRTARKVIIQIEISPVGDGSVADSTKVGFQVKSTVPTKKSRSYSMRVYGGRELQFNEASPSDARQGTLDDIESD